MQKEVSNFNIPRELPIIFPATQRMLHRLAPNTSEYKSVYEKMDSARAGFNGERQVDRQLLKLFPIENFYVFPDLFIQINPNWYIQIDTLIITDKYILILEIKTYRGTLHFEENPYSLIQQVEQETFVRKCPQLQVLGYLDGLKKWISRLGFNLPIYAFLVLGYPTVQVKTPPKLVPLLQAQQVPLRITKLNGEHPSVLSGQELEQLVRLIKEANNPYLAFPLSDYYRVDSSLIKPGVVCVECGIPMYRLNRKIWTCSNCKISSSDAPLRAIEDWLMIMKTTISNEECRNWIGLKDKYAANHLLKNSSLVHTGQFKDRRYHFPKNRYEIYRE